MNGHAYAAMTQFRVGEPVGIAQYQHSVLGVFAGVEGTPTYGGGRMVYVDGLDGARYWCADTQVIRRDLCPTLGDTSPYGRTLR